VVLFIVAVLGFAAFGWNGLCLAEIARLAPPGGVAAATAGTMLAIYAGASLGPAVFGVSLGISDGPAAGCMLLAIVALAPVAWLRR
jgi:hypothetical protein